MFHILIVTLLLGLGAAAPIGPINLEIIRRHLQSGFITGMIFGSGACSADLTYLLLLSLGVLTLLTHSVLISSMGIVGSLILFWFGFSAIRLTSKLRTSRLKQKSYPAHFRDGYLLTLSNPYTLLFWSSMSTQVATLTVNRSHYAVLFGCIGVLMGTLLWVTGLNLLLYFSKKLLSEKFIHKINIGGGILLIAMAAYLFIHSLVALSRYYTAL